MSLRRVRKKNNVSEPRGRQFRLDPEALARIEEYSEPEEDWANYDMPEEEPEERPRRKHRLLRWLVVRVIVLSLIVILFNIAVLFFTGRLWFNEPKKRDYPIRGPVITEDMGRIDWERFSQQNIQMAYIRATKSTTYVDASFEANRKGSAATDLPVGMLHVFDLGMDGADQARHFIEAAGSSGTLPPAVEVERSGVYSLIPLDEDKLLRELYKFAGAVEAEYGGLVIKCSGKIYDLITADERFDGYMIWYVSELSKPGEDVRYDFWGYSSRVKFSFYESRSYLEMTLFNGSEEEFAEILR